jgi:CheY-like chemotaxis protein
MLYNGRDGLLRATAERYDAIVLDRMLPGLGLLATLRTVGIDTGPDPQRPIGGRRACTGRARAAMTTLQAV